MSIGDTSFDTLDDLLDTSFENSPDMIGELSYLKAIQKIPGETASEKMKWLGKLSQNQLKDEQKASGDIDAPSELQPILRVQTAVRKKIHEDITSALKSDDVTIVRRALQASWFFDGSHKNIIDVKYFREQIFPYVSMNTRLHIIKLLALRLKDPQFAQQMFTEVELTYGIQCALSLIVACDEEFAYNTIVNKKINLPFAIAKKIFRRNIDFIVRYLRLSNPSVNNSFRINIDSYVTFLPTLVKKRLDTFVELYEMHEKNPPPVQLSGTCANVFLKKGIDYLMRKPRLYIKIIPLKKINATIMEKLFPALLPENINDFQVKEALRYLKHYPEDKKYDFLSKTYKDKYGVEFLATLKNVTPDTLLLMPAKERIKQARIMIMTELGKTFMDGDNKDIMASMIWLCYLPTAESIPCIKHAIIKATTTENRIDLLYQIIKTCNVNKDEDALIDFLKYFLNRHKNEEDEVFDKMLNKIASLYDMPHLSEKVWSVLNEIIDLLYVKFGYVTQTVLLDLIHHKLLHDKPIAQEIEMLIETQLNKTYVNFEDIFIKYPHYKRQCLVVCAEVLMSQCRIGKWKKKEDVLVYYLVNTMYRFNEECNKEKNKSYKEIKRLTINDFPWLKIALEQVVQKYPHYENCVRDLFYKHEPELYHNWFKETDKSRIKDIETGKVYKILKQDLPRIVCNWKDYLKACKIHIRKKSMHRFFRATRWYNSLPFLFLNECFLFWNNERDGNYLVIIALLLHGDAVAKIVEPLIPTGTQVDTTENARDKYILVKTLPLVMKVSNPSVPLELIARLCEGDYLTVASMALTCACRRSPLPMVMSFAENLADKRVSVTKYGIRMMYLVAPVQQVQHYLLSWWQTKQHHSVRIVVLKSAQDLFFKNPDSNNWSLYKSLISTMNVADDLLFSELDSRLVPTEYIVDYIELLFNVIHKLLAQGLSITKVLECIITVLQMITEETCDNLNDGFVKMLLQRYLFNQNEQLSSAAVNFTISLLTTKKKGNTRMEIFSDVFKKEVKEGWDKSHPKKSGFYPVNHIVHTFIDSFVNETFVKEMPVHPKVMNKMLETFLSVLKPEMDFRSYMLLVYAVERAKSKSPLEFGIRVGTRMRDINMFSPMLVPFMSNVLKNLPLKQTFGIEKFEDATHDFVQGLIETEIMEFSFIAADLLRMNIPSCNPKYHQLVKRLMDLNYPPITTILNNRKNELSFELVEFDAESN